MRHNTERSDSGSGVAAWDKLMRLGGRILIHRPGIGRFTWNAMQWRKPFETSSGWTVLSRVCVCVVRKPTILYYHAWNATSSSTKPFSDATTFTSKFHVNNSQRCCGWNERRASRANNVDSTPKSAGEHQWWWWWWSSFFVFGSMKPEHMKLSLQVRHVAFRKIAIYKRVLFCSCAGLYFAPLRRSSSVPKSSKFSRVHFLRCRDD